ncbi:hypothetical protein LCGC14_2400260, partial [marine sediment metagenome]
MKHRHINNQKGIALVLVLMLVAVGTILGMGLIASSTVRVIGAQNLVHAARAHYLAESGLSHALHVLKSDPESLIGSAATPLGPYYLQDDQDCYYFYSTQDAFNSNVYYLTAKSYVNGLSRRASYTVFCQRQRLNKLTQSVLIGGSAVALPDSLTVNGDIQSNGGRLSNYASIVGDVYCRGVVFDPFGRVDGEITMGADEVPLPTIITDNYKLYRLWGRNNAANERVTNEFLSNDPLNQGGSVNPDNTGGVVWLKPQSGDSVAISNGVDFQGTIIIEGDLTLSGSGIKMVAVRGFPAIVATGKILIADNADAEITGTVIAGGGIVPLGSDAAGSATTIDGALVAQTVGYGWRLDGDHVLNYVKARTELYD